MVLSVFMQQKYFVFCFDFEVVSLLRLCPCWGCVLAGSHCTNGKQKKIGSWCKTFQPHVHLPCSWCDVSTEWLFRRVVWALDVYPDMCIGIIDDTTITVMCVLFVSVCAQVLNVFSMSLLENDLYVINYQNHSIVKIHRYDPVRPAALVSGTFGSPNIIKVLHQVRQPQRGFTLIYGEQFGQWRKWFEIFLVCVTATLWLLCVTGSYS